ncbi:hypothetical protein ACFSO9_07240 [Mesonia maritima]|uniref:hypothetical protein n=1 Tax=Mesonia maritima TaxID=1793873 RepID=UPI0036360631
MTKRIVSFKINNCRAYYGKYNALTLPNGENVLIYGENGSGKSSLYKAMNNFFAKSNNPSLSFVKNRYLNHLDGEIKLTFAEFTISPYQIVSGTDSEYVFGNKFSDNNIPFIQTASLVKGFLDYTDLLKVYLHKEERPNLFDLIVLSLLANHIPIASGGNFKFKNKWEQLQRNLIEESYTRNNRSHKNAISELPIYEVHLRSTLDSVFQELNRLLNTYFPDLGIQLKYILLPLAFNYGDKWQWHTTSDLRLDVCKDGVSITGDYSDFLNEARLSAISICLYLASLLKNPTSVDLKVLFLDDVIGLDAGNRIPILNILRTEFSSYQIFISTYDRHWFELAKRQFEVYDDNSWSTLEIYVGSETVNHNIIPKPILVTGMTNYEKGIQYLHNNIRPDYPASSNYFRKSIEEIIQNLVPKYELVGLENTQLADYKLTSLLLKTKNFLTKIEEDTSEINKIIGLLHNLIHPFSHHEITSPIYKNELLILEDSIPKLKKQLIDLDIENNYKCILEKGKNIKITFTVNSAISHFYYYELKLKENIILKKDRIPNISFCKCHVEKIYGTKNGTQISESRPSKNNPIFNYTSLKKASDLIYDFLQTFNGAPFPKNHNYLDQIEYHDGGNWIPFKPKTIW